MAQKRTGLGRGIGALIPSAPESGERAVDVFFPAPRLVRADWSLSLAQSLPR